MTISIGDRQDGLIAGFRFLAEEGHFNVNKSAFFGNQGFGTVEAVEWVIRHTVAPAILDEAERELCRLEGLARETARIKATVEQIDRVREEQERPLSDEEQAEIDAELERARLIAERRDSVEGRLERVEQMLEKLVAKSEAR